MPDDQMELPITPYRGTGGYAKGSPSSRLRAEREVTSGVLARRQQQVLDLLSSAGSEGLTWKEAGGDLGLHHGQISGALSNLHRAGLVFQVLERRNGCLPYVHAEYRSCWLPDARRDVPSTRRAASTSEVAPMVAAALRAIGSDFGVTQERLAEIPEVASLLAVCLMAAMPD